jgi:tetrahydromethanopterin S-methyltransferase subunit H
MTKHINNKGIFGSQAALQSRSLNACKQCLDEAFYHVADMVGNPQVEELIGMIQDCMIKAIDLRTAADDRLEDKD